MEDESNTYFRLKLGVTRRRFNNTKSTFTTKKWASYSSWIVPPSATRTLQRFLLNIPRGEETVPPLPRATTHHHAPHEQFVGEAVLLRTRKREAKFLVETHSPFLPALDGSPIDTAAFLSIVHLLEAIIEPLLVEAFHIRACFIHRIFFTRHHLPAHPHPPLLMSVTIEIPFHHQHRILRGYLPTVVIDCFPLLRPSAAPCGHVIVIEARQEVVVDET